MANSGYRHWGLLCTCIINFCKGGVMDKYDIWKTTDIEYERNWIPDYWCEDCNKVHEPEDFCQYCERCIYVIGDLDEDSMFCANCTEQAL